MSPRLLLAGFGSFPAAPLNPSAAVIATLARESWAPVGAVVDYLTLPVQWQGATETILRQLQTSPADGVLVVGIQSKLSTRTPSSKQRAIFKAFLQIYSSTAE